jgi:hypothetical protein
VSIVIERSTLELLFGLCEDVFMFVMIEAPVAAAVGGAHLSDGEALAVHFYAVSFLAGAS